MIIQGKHLRAAAWIIYQEEREKATKLLALVRRLITEAETLKKAELKKRVDKPLNSVKKD